MALENTGSTFSTIVIDDDNGPNAILITNDDENVDDDTDITEDTNDNNSDINDQNPILATEIGGVINVTVEEEKAVVNAKTTTLNDHQPPMVAVVRFDQKNGYCAENVENDDDNNSNNKNNDRKAMVAVEANIVRAPTVVEEKAVVATQAVNPDENPSPVVAAELFDEKNNGHNAATSLSIPLLLGGVGVSVAAVTAAVIMGEPSLTELTLAAQQSLYEIGAIMPALINFLC